MKKAKILESDLFKRYCRREGDVNGAETMFEIRF